MDYIPKTPAWLFLFQSPNQTNFESWQIFVAGGVFR